MKLTPTLWVIFLETDNFMTLAGLLIFALCHALLVNLFAVLLFFSASLLATHLGEELSYFFWKEPGPAVDSKIYFDFLFTMESVLTFPIICWKQ